MARARAYFALQAVAGVAWWVALAWSDDVRRWTLGGWSPSLLAGPDLLLFVGASALAAVLASRVWAVIAASWTTAVTVALVGYALVTREAGWGALLMTAVTAGTLLSTATLWSGRVPVQWFFIGPFAFRVAAAHRTPVQHLRRSLVQVVIFWTTFLLLLPVALSLVEERLRLDAAWLDTAGWTAAGGALFVVASALGLWSCVAMALRGEGTPLPADTAQRLVVTGPYRLVRNPMAVAGAGQTVGAGLWLGSWLVVLSAVLGGLIWNAFIRPEEEADLARRFGPGYDAYRSTVRCWVPTRRRPIAAA